MYLLSHIFFPYQWATIKRKNIPFLFRSILCVKKEHYYYLLLALNKFNQLTSFCISINIKFFYAHVLKMGKISIFYINIVF